MRCGVVPCGYLHWVENLYGWDGIRVYYTEHLKEIDQRSSMVNATTYSFPSRLTDLYFSLLMSPENMSRQNHLMGCTLGVQLTQPQT